MALPVVNLDARPRSSFISQILYLNLRGRGTQILPLLIFTNYTALLNLDEANFRIQRDPVIERAESLILFVHLNIVYIIAIMQWFRSFKTPLRPSKDHVDKEEANYSAAQLRTLLKGVLKGCEYDIRKEFAEYLADPSRFVPAYSKFSRREQILGIVETVGLNLLFARLPSREWSKIDSRVPGSWDLPSQVLGWIAVFISMWVMVGDGRRQGMSFKVGRIAREIRRDCLRVACSETRCEECESEVRERLQWWVVEVLREAEEAELLEAGSFEDGRKSLLE